MTIAADHPAGRLFVPGVATAAVTSAPASPVAVRPVTWSKVDTGFHVASRAGEYMGSVDTTPDGHFVAFDATSAPIGRYAELADAKKAVLSWKPERTRIRERRFSETVAPIAASAGLVAVATAALGALLSVVPG